MPPSPPSLGRSLTRKMRGNIPGHNERERERGHLLVTVQPVAAPSELRGDIPLVAHVLKTHGASFKMQILLLKHKYWTDLPSSRLYIGPDT